MSENVTTPEELEEHELQPHEGGILETLESITIAFVLAFVFRAFVVEAFVIPTGSMAPTLLGQHIQATCPQCGYRYDVGPRDTYSAADGTTVAEPVQGLKRGPLELPCPMCGYELEERTIRASGGDRILVLKYLYALSEPRRWDVVVFKNPREPDVNYIKRLVGLPGEQIWIVDGNVYSRPLDPEGRPDEAALWQIQRKTDRIDAQRAVWQPVYRSDYFPLDAGRAEGDSERHRDWRLPWQPAGHTAGAWDVQRGLRWRWGVSEAGGLPDDAEGTLEFDFAEQRYRFNYSPYNLYDSQRGFDDDVVGEIGEMRLGVTVSPQHANADLTLTLGGRFFTVRGRIGPDGHVSIEAAQRGGPVERFEQRATGITYPLPPNRGTRVELWHVDQSVSLFVDGHLVAGPWEYSCADFGMTLPQLAEMHNASRPEPRASVTISGAPATLRSLDLDRDLYYTQTLPGHGPGRSTRSGPATIAPDRFFCLGDNSPSSEDSRRWTDVDPWVTAVHDTPPGFVPRELMLGRAFFVYYPATHPLGRFPLGVPNFGDMRFIH